MSQCSENVYEYKIDIDYLYHFRLIFVSNVKITQTVCYNVEYFLEQ